MVGDDLSEPMGRDPLYVSARRVLLDALEALDNHRAAVVLVGAQAIYVYTGDLSEIQVAAFTLDADLIFNPLKLESEPHIEKMLRGAGFFPQRNDHGGINIGIWERTGATSTVDLLVPETVVGGGRRSANLGSQGDNLARRVQGLEAALVDQEPHVVASLDDTDLREFEILIAGPAALLVAKTYKINERLQQARRGGRGRQKPKDALDCFRLLRAISTDDLTKRFTQISQDDRSRNVTKIALGYLDTLFSTEDGEGARLLADAVGVGYEAEAVASCVRLTADILKACRSLRD